MSWNRLVRARTESKCPVVGACQCPCAWYDFAAHRLGMTAVGGDGGYHFDCSVCADALDADDQSVVTLECGHTFHATCIVRWFRIGGSTCPNCRADRGDAVWRIHTRGTRLSQMRRRAHNRLTPDVRSSSNGSTTIEGVYARPLGVRFGPSTVTSSRGRAPRRLRRDYAAKPPSSPARWTRCRCAACRSFRQRMWKRKKAAANRTLSTTASETRKRLALSNRRQCDHCC